MSNPDPVFIVSALATAVSAVVTIAQAVPNIDRRLGRVHDIERELGHLPRLIKLLYVYPQYFYKDGLIGTTLLGLLMVGAFTYRVFDPTAPMHPVFERLKDSGIWLFALWLVLGASMYTNALSRLLVWTGLMVTWPLPIRDIFGLRRLDQDAAWPSLGTFLEFNENARPIVVSPANAAAFADWLVRTVRKRANAPVNRASPPPRPAGMDDGIFRERLGNALLTGCVIEEGHYRSAGFPRRDWQGFYDSVGEIAIQTTLLSADTLRESHSRAEYYDELLAELNRRLLERDQATIPDSPKLIETLQSILGIVAGKYAGKAADIDPGRDGWFRSRSEVIYARMRELSLWNSETMQAQFVKLAVVWNIWGQFPVGEFTFPVTKRIAALLLDRGVILAPEDLRVLTFDDTKDRTVARTAEAMVAANAISLVEADISKHGWLPPASRGTGGELLRWWIAYEVDLRLWDYATRLSQGEQIPDDPGLTRWQLSYGQVARVKTV